MNQPGIAWPWQRGYDDSLRFVESLREILAAHPSE